MTNNGFAADFLQILLGWLQSLFNGIWALFSGGSGGSVLRWLSENWLSLLLALLIFGFLDGYLSTACENVFNALVYIFSIPFGGLWYQ